MDPHYVGVASGYGAATLALWLLVVVAKSIVAAPEPVAFQRPWLESGIVIAAAVATIGIGQLYLRDMLLPDNGVAFRTLNQAAIFAPILLAVFSLPARMRGAGLPLAAPMAGLGVGVALAAGAVVVYALAREFSPGDVVTDIVAIDNIPHAAQVLFEDIAIAALLLRLRSAVGPAWSIVLAAALFAVGHIPAMLASGATLAEMTSLLFDTAIGIMVVGAILRTRSIWWFWPLHTALDLTQFYAPGP
jgi:hypothetical protein